MCVIKGAGVCFGSFTNSLKMMRLLLARGGLIQTSYYALKYVTIRLQGVVALLLVGGIRY